MAISPGSTISPPNIRAVVVIDRVVEPGRYFHPLLALRHDGGVGEGGIGQLLPVLRIGNMIARETRIDRRTLHAAAPRIRIIGKATVTEAAGSILLVGDHIGGVIGDEHFGTNEEFKAFVDAAHARGMKVYMDIIANHTADVIKYRECEADKPCALTPPLRV